MKNSNSDLKSCIPETPNFLTNKNRSTNIFFFEKKSIWKDSLFLRLYELVHRCLCPPVEHLPHVDLPLVESGTTPCFKALQVGWQVHQATSRTPPTCGWSMNAIQNNSFFRALQVSLQVQLPCMDNPCMQSSKNSLFLGLYELVHECTSPPVEHLQRGNNPRLRGGAV